MVASPSWESMQSDQQTKIMKLDFGCGQAKTPGYLGMDGFAGADIDIVHDFDIFPYPFADSVFDEIICRSSLEHVAHFMDTMVELHRIAKPNALIQIYCPHYSSPDAYRDPTHKTFFAYTTFDFFANGGSYHSKHTGLFAIQKRSFGLPENTGWLKSIPKNLFNAYPDFYETRLCWILPAKTIYYELRVIK
jgi:SAM-dependent methyltransferase